VLSEFKGAIVPKETPPRVIETLKNTALKTLKSTIRRSNELPPERLSKA